MFNDIVVIVTGCRHYAKEWKVREILNSYMPRTVVEGNCPTGADLFARRWCRDHGIHPKSYTAAFTELGPKAGPIRNGRMLRDWMHFPNVRVIAFPMEGGRGTQDCMKQARGLKMIVENYGDVEF